MSRRFGTDGVRGIANVDPMNHSPYPLLLTPVYKDYIWGGTQIPKRYNRPDTPTPCAESWEVSCHPDGTTLVENGPCAGTPLSQLWQGWGEAIAGEAHQDSFPLLIKLIDARDDLSVQVHPNNTNAHLFNGEPKTEMWYILHAEPGAQIYAGLRAGVTRDVFIDALESDRLEEVLAAIPAKPGAAVFMPGGCVHAIGKGCLILEAQQSSNTTYRVYDWGRVGADGKPRETHRKQALGVIDWEPHGSALRQSVPETDSPEMSVSTLVSCDFFTTRALTLKTTASRMGEGKSFRAYFAPDTDVQLSTPSGDLLLPRGRSALIPAAITELTLTPDTPGATLIEMTP